MKIKVGVLKALSAAAILAVATASPVQAASVSYYLDQSNDLPDGINYAQVTISDGAGGDIDFSVEVLTSAFSVTDPVAQNFGMQNFSFN